MLWTLSATLGVIDSQSRAIDDDTSRRVSLRRTLTAPRTSLPCFPKEPPALTTLLHRQCNHRKGPLDDTLRRSAR